MSKYMKDHVLICDKWSEELYVKMMKNSIDRRAKIVAAFMDPPDNRGLRYWDSRDHMGKDLYIAKLEEWIRTAFSAVSGAVWISFGSEYTRDVSRIVDSMEDDWPDIACRECIQTYTFGQHNQHDFGRNYRPLWRLQLDGCPVYTDSIRIQSERQKAGDKRADPRGRVPGDVFNFARVTGNSKQRRRWHPTQLHEGLVERCLLSCAKPGQRVLDLFSGTGTVIRVAKKIGLKTLSVESSAHYCEKLLKEHNELEVIF